MFTLLNKPNIKLVYIDNKGSLPDTEGTLRIAKIIHSFLEKNETWYEVMLLTDINGREINDNSTMLIPKSRVVERKNKDLRQKFIYITDITAKYFVKKSGNDITVDDREVPFDINKGPLIATTRNGLGSGIYGFYQKISSATKINVKNPYIIQDKSVGEAITNASLMTNRYLDNIITKNNNISNIDQALQMIENDNIDYLTTLWNIVFYFVNQYLSQTKLEEILASYLIKFYQNDLFDDTGVAVTELPINFIMINMGYDSLISDDLFNNSWDRGCVSYNYDLAQKLIGNKAPY